MSGAYATGMRSLRSIFILSIKDSLATWQMITLQDWVTPILAECFGQPITLADQLATQSLGNRLIFNQLLG